MINESFEEQQKQSKIFENAAMKNFFSSQANKSSENSGLCGDLDSSVRSTTSEEKAPHERMPYTAAITKNKKRVAYKEDDSVIPKHCLPSN